MRNHVCPLDVNSKNLEVSLTFNNFLWIHFAWIYPSLLEFIYISPQSLTMLFPTFLFVQLAETPGQENKAKVFFRIWPVYSLVLSYIINSNYLLITITQVVGHVHVCTCTCVCVCVCVCVWVTGGKGQDTNILKSNFKILCKGALIWLSSWLPYYYYHIKKGAVYFRWNNV